MRTTIDLDPVVLAQLKQKQREEGKSLGQLVSELLARELARCEPQRSDISWVAANLGRPLIDLEDKDALNAALDRAE
ncbi:antitoxin [Skermania sp. ID1734]|uniref:antitoxin n=1 Tax=Skermania sp. ID1734 TaxID=2597516 RepID=UPI00117C6EB9|nr:antitoxin [Skermania sp. ID1734]TSD99297.1 antitoxin [Skermania sp. ID1734]